MVLWFILFLVVWGLVVGALARLALPGPDPMSVLANLVLGHAGGLIFSVIGAIVLLYLHRRFVQHRPLAR